MYIEKYQATGNDFIMFKEELKNPSEIAAKVCDRHFGIGANGILYPSKSQIADIKMNYYNSDGSIAKMCGNGIRAFAKFVFEHRLIKNTSFSVETLAGIKFIEIQDGLVRVDIGPAELNLGLDDLTKINNGLEPYNFQKVDGYILKVGTMHTIVYLEEETMTSENLGLIIQKDPLFKDETNVNFVEVIDESTLKVTTFERGAGWTLSCGTGVSASAFHAYITKRVSSNQLDVIVPGGLLKVEIQDEKLYLIGPAEKIVKGEWQ